jgi:hypothetical protein
MTGPYSSLLLFNTVGIGFDPVQKAWKSSGLFEKVFALESVLGFPKIPETALTTEV